MSMGNIINAPKASSFRLVLKQEYNASLKTMQGFWVVVESGVGLYVGRLEAINPDHGDIILNSVERVDVSFNCDKVWIRGSQVKQLIMVGKNDKSRAVKRAEKILLKIHKEEKVL